MNIKRCEWQYRRGIRCRRRFGKMNYYAATIFAALYLPSDQSELLSFQAGWDETQRSRL